jgi:CheY-like chemotaxis protein
MAQARATGGRPRPCQSIRRAGRRIPEILRNRAMCPAGTAQNGAISVSKVVGMMYSVSNWTGRMRVLMIDDDPEYMGLCTIILRDDGHDVTACSDFNEGRRLLVDGGHFEALIADVRLGAYNGLHLIAIAPPSIIRIALSAFLDPVIRRDAEQAGARFVVKPADCASVSALLSQTDQGAAAQPV